MSWKTVLSPQSVRDRIQRDKTKQESDQSGKKKHGGPPNHPSALVHSCFAAFSSRCGEACGDFCKRPWVTLLLDTLRGPVRRLQLSPGFLLFWTLISAARHCHGLKRLRTLLPVIAGDDQRAIRALRGATQVPPLQ